MNFLNSIFKSEYRWFWLVVFLLHGSFLLMQLNFGRMYLVDSEEYITEAENIIHEGKFYCGDLAQPVRYDDFTKRPPVYPLFIAGIRLLAGSDSVLLFLQMILSIASISMVMILLRDWGFENSGWKFLLPFLVLYPAQYIYMNMVMSEILFQFFLTGMVFCAIRGVQQQSWKWLWGYLICLILGMLTKPILYLFIIPHAGMMIYLMWRWKTLKGLIPLVVPFLVVWGYMQWNEARTGYFHFSGIQNLSLLQYTTYNLLIHTYGPEKALEMADAILYRSLAQPTFVEGQKLLSRECTAVIMEHKVAFLMFHFKGMFNFFIDPGRFDLYTFFDLQNADAGQGFLGAFSEGGYKGVISFLGQQPLAIIFLLVLVALANGLKLLSVGVFAFCRKISLLDRVIVIGVILYIAGLTGSSGASRFAVPVFPLLLLTIPCFFSKINDLRSVSSRMKAG